MGLYQSAELLTLGIGRFPNLALACIPPIRAASARGAPSRIAAIASSRRAWATSFVEPDHPIPQRLPVQFKLAN